MASSFGHQLRCAIFGESHGEMIGMTLDGLPPGEPIDEAHLATFMARRAPGKQALTTTRKEADAVHIASGVFEGHTTGFPLFAYIQNTNQRSKDYKGLSDVMRPSHADYTAALRYKGFADMRGGGHFSGRLTAPLCIAGGIALQILERQGITIGAQLCQVGAIKGPSLEQAALSAETLTTLSSAPFPTLDTSIGEAMQASIRHAFENKDSIGGAIECAVLGFPAGIGSPMFDGIENRLSQILFAIPGCKGVAFGAGFDAVEMYGSQHNDSFYMDGDRVKTRTNHAGGILGGISTGMPLTLRIAMKPTPSIAQTQETISLEKLKNTTLEVHGRHDPCIAIRAVPVVEAVVAIVLLDLLLEEGHYERSN